MVQPLDGIKVLDLSRLMPGPFCSRLLSDFGAEILCIEEAPEALRLSERRQVTSPTTIDNLTMTRPYSRRYRNKKSILLNLKRDEGREIIYRLARESDVFLEGFRPGVAQRLGIGYDNISSINPRIVYCSTSLYGQDGPYAQFPGHDPCALSVSGIIAHDTLEGEQPRLFGILVSDYFTAYNATVGILLALRARDLTGEGQYVDISMTDTCLDLIESAAESYFMGKRPSKLNRPNPIADVWQTKDGKFITTSNFEAHHWANFCRAIGCPELVEHQHDRNREWRKKMRDLVKEKFLTKTRNEWLELLRRPEMESQVAPVLEIDEVLTDPQILHRQMVVELKKPEGGTVKQLGMPIKLTKTPGKIRTLAPFPGEHTEEVLTSLGYSQQEIDQLEGKGVIARWKG